ncbi:MAG: DUF4956 domain-containing protein [Erysipelotrichaceae bacterium]
MSALDFIKKSILEQFSGTISLPQLLIALVVSFMLGLFITYIYKKTYTGVVYSKNFALCIVLLAMVTSLVTMTISSNITLSLGMVGALSIVRFRTAVKEPVDTAFMFWGIGVGIMCGAGLFVAGILGSFGLGAMYLFAYMIGFRVSSRFLLVIRYNALAHENVKNQLSTLSGIKLKSNSMFENDVEVTYEIDVNDKKNTDVVENFKLIDGVKNVSLISYQNDFGD